MNKSINKFQKVERERKRDKRKKEKMERKLERKESDGKGPQIDWESAPNNATLSNDEKFQRDWNQKQVINK